jgi:hypothetical protein
MFIEEVKLWFRLCNKPASNKQRTSLFRLDILHHPTAPCHVKDVKFDVIDVTNGFEKISRGASHSYLTFLLHKERKYEIINEVGFKKRLSWIPKAVSDRETFIYKH